MSEAPSHVLPPPAGVDDAESRRRGGRRRDKLVLVAGSAAVLAIGALLLIRAAYAVNRVALVESPRPVTVLAAQPATYRDQRTYVGAVDPWIEANVGPQFISAYVQTVLVRPGAVVNEGDVLATLECTNANAASRAVEMQARAVEARKRAVADEAARVREMLDGGFVALNEVEKKTEQSAAEEAAVLETKAKLLAASLDVRDCILRAPFDGEIATRTADPGAFVKPGTAVVSEVDRNTVRIAVDAPEKDFDAIAPGTQVRIRMLATGAQVTAPISRRAPKADARTRTVHFEIDVSDPRREYPVGTTAIVEVDVGAAVAATAVPIYVASQREGKARLFVVENGIAHARHAPVVGERGGVLFLDPKALPAGAQVVTEGRALLSEGDAVSARSEAPPPVLDGDAGAPRGAGFGRPL